MEPAITQGQPGAEWTDDDLRRALVAASGLLDLGPPPEAQTALAELIATLERELVKRPGIERQPREIAELNDAELNQAIRLAAELRELRPRYVPATEMVNLLVAIAQEERRRVLGQRRRTDWPDADCPNRSGNLSSQPPASEGVKYGHARQAAR
jgi:hypothetical protein